MQVRSSYMHFQIGHIAASSSPMYGGGPRWGANDFTLNKIEMGDKRLICALSPIPAFPRNAGEGDAAKCRY